ncbi:MAG: NAD-dependent protein deacylase [Eubacteriales bacterium]
MNDKLKEVIFGGGSAVFLGGAGVSTASGIPDFRSSGGIYGKNYDYPAEVILSGGFFWEQTCLFYEFYREKMLPPCLGAKPNACHLALARLENEGLLDAVITQNIDNLHQRAGSRNVRELHGSVCRNFCHDCGRAYGAEYIMESETVPTCGGCGGVIKPDVVLYGEQLNNECLKRSAESIGSADTLIVGGTSLSVYPAAGLIDLFKGKTLVLINKTPTPYDFRADLIIREDISKALAY